jgi:hypothetical protein
MDINQIHPTLRKATASFPKLPVTSGFGRVLTRSLLPMLLPKSKAPAGITIEQVKTSGGLKLRIYNPAGQRTRAAMLYIHGGGHDRYLSFGVAPGRLEANTVFSYSLCQPSGNSIPKTMTLRVNIVNSSKIPSSSSLGW